MQFEFLLTLKLWLFHIFINKHPTLVYVNFFVIRGVPMPVFLLAIFRTTTTTTALLLQDLSWG